MREFLASLLLCVVVGGGAVIAKPYDGDPPGWWPRDRVKIVTVFVCAPKDESRMAQGILIPKLVQTESFQRAADVAPAIQAQETQRKKKSSRR